MRAMAIEIDGRRIVVDANRTQTYTFPANVTITMYATAEDSQHLFVNGVQIEGTGNSHIQGRITSKTGFRFAANYTQIESLEEDRILSDGFNDGLL